MGTITGHCDVILQSCATWSVYTGGASDNAVSVTSGGRVPRVINSSATAAVRNTASAPTERVYARPAGMDDTVR